MTESNESPKRTWLVKKNTGQLQVYTEKALAEVWPMKDEYIRADVAQAENNRLREALEKYGQHIGRCVSSAYNNPGQIPCTCGFEQALKGAE